MSDNKPNESGHQSRTPPANAKANGTMPTVTARRPISKDEYARTTKATPDTTAVIPAVREDQPAPAEVKKPAPAPAVDDRPTQTMKAVPADAAVKAPTEPKTHPKPGSKKAEKKKPFAAKKAAPETGAVAAAGAAGAAASVTTAPAPAAPAPATPTKKAEPKKVEEQKAEPTPAKPAAKQAPATTSTAQGATTAPAAESSRSARLKVSHIEPWTVTKMAFVVSVALMIVSVVAVTVFWLVLQATGVWGALNDSVSNVLADDAAAFDVTEYLGFGRVVGVTLLISSLNVIFMTALATIAAHLYNLAAGILGGVEVTFGERQ